MKAALPRLAVVAGIALVMVFLLVPRFIPSVRPLAPRAQARRMLRVYRQAIERALFVDGRCPLHRAQLTPYLNGPSRDPWGSGLLIACSPDGYSVVSAGPDRQFGTDDDLEEVGPREETP